MTTVCDSSLTFAPYGSSLVYEVLVVFDGPFVAADHDLPLGVRLSSQDDPDRCHGQKNGHWRWSEKQSEERSLVVVRETVRGTVTGGG